MKFEQLLEYEQKSINDYSFVASHTEYDDGISTDIHWHDYYEIEILTNGKIKHDYNDQTQYAYKGDSFLLTPLDFHKIEMISCVKIINIKFVLDILPDSLRKCFDTILCCSSHHFENDDLNYIIERYNRLSSLNSEMPFYKEQVNAIICEIISIYLSKTTSNPEQHTSSLFQQTISYITRNFRNDISCKTIARELSVTPNHLGATFRKHVNTSIGNYINSIRLTYARNLLVNTNLGIKEVASESGYNSQEHFMYVFKKLVGYTPTQYRSKSQKTL